VKLDSGFRRR